ncbi:uncharacterized protein LACBIDRAFT_298711 [Laccaria bicolor S238N-H82]|uniref:Predicted protein n=1 Tax=Laccaria bicolor (strain S238N-H82 / ATCC MYA-4686) TaxID=486041 RepID=B0DDG7_LACBS|nr:uncharacterized protein LACBIDRAFT_298711 [Laccaria bicolor S238N-H82]EDR07605.1 predicted protein [Laccaria bicolor S238N-H82]|eukprot:XP_001881997.1 predicted protein [Laccaria bicolor S238N-H82]
MQVQAVLADLHGLDSLISAGTDSGKTLPTALKILLDNPADHLITIMLSPLKCLQVMQQNDFNSCYGICMVVINEDTPHHEAWWDVLPVTKSDRTPDSDTMAGWISILFGGCQDNMKCSRSPNFHNTWTKSD